MFGRTKVLPIDLPLLSSSFSRLGDLDDAALVPVGNVDAVENFRIFSSPILRMTS